MAFSESEGHAFDEVGIEEIYKKLNIPYYSKVDFAHLAKYETKFLFSESSERRRLQKRADGFYLGKRSFYAIIYITVKSLKKYMYIHFWCRPMSYKVKNFSDNAKYLIYSDVVKINRLSLMRI